MKYCEILFYRSRRDMNIPDLYKYLRNACNEDLLTTIKIIFHIRDCRGGKGERKIARYAFIWLFINYPEEFWKIIHLIPEYGRWDDILQFFPKVLKLDNLEYVKKNYISESITADKLKILRCLQYNITKYYGNQLVSDLQSMKRKEPCTLAAKWAPTEGCSLDYSFGVYNSLCDAMEITEKELRTIYLTPLRKYLCIPERKICKNKWRHVNYDKVPFNAWKRLKKAFSHHDGLRYSQWITTKTQFIKPMRINEMVEYTRKQGRNNMINIAWESLEKQIKTTGLFKNTAIVCDISPRLGKYIDTVVSLGLMISSCNRDNSIISCDNIPSLVKLHGDLFQKYNQLIDFEHGKPTITNSLGILMGKGIDKLFILSKGYTEENLDKVREIYTKFGYKLPEIIFWDFTENNFDIDVAVTDNIKVITGYSPYIIDCILTGTEIDSEKIMNRVINSNRYNIINTFLPYDLH